MWIGKYLSNNPNLKLRPQRTKMIQPDDEKKNLESTEFVKRKKTSVKLKNKSKKKLTIKVPKDEKEAKGF